MRGLPSRLAPLCASLGVTTCSDAAAPNTEATGMPALHCFPSHSPPLSPLPLPSFPPSALSVASCHAPSFPEYARGSNLPSEHCSLCRNERPLARFPPKLCSNPLLHRNSLAPPWPSWTRHPPDTRHPTVTVGARCRQRAHPFLFLSEALALAGRGAACTTAGGDRGQRHSSDTPSAEVNGRLSG